LLRAKRQIWQSYQTLWRNIGRSVGWWNDEWVLLDDGAGHKTKENSQR
jgi:hypothetical protein